MDDSNGALGTQLSRRRVLQGAAVASAGLLVPRVARAAEPWETIAREEGFVIQVRAEPGRQFPSYRGMGRIKANRWKLLSVFSDAERHEEWMHRCIDSRLLEHPGPGEYVVYSRSEAPWPAKDRDLVYSAKTEVRKDGRDIVVHGRETSHHDAPSLERGVIRIPRMRSMVRLVAVDEETTMVVYQVNADPGGMVPDWIVKMTSKNRLSVPVCGRRTGLIAA